LICTAEPAETVVLHYARHKLNHNALAYMNKIRGLASERQNKDAGGPENKVMGKMCLLRSDEELKNSA
jgi:hypothetical protein